MHKIPTDGASNVISNQDSQFDVIKKKKITPHQVHNSDTASNVSMFVPLLKMGHKLHAILWPTSHWPLCTKPENKHLHANCVSIQTVGSPNGSSPYCQGNTSGFTFSGSGIDTRRKTCAGVIMKETL